MPDRKNELCITDTVIIAYRDYLFPSEEKSYKDAPQLTKIISYFYQEYKILLFPAERCVLTKRNICGFI